jgi:hypothetical protein
MKNVCARQASLLHRARSSLVPRLNRQHSHTNLPLLDSIVSQMLGHLLWSMARLTEIGSRKDTQYASMSVVTAPAAEPYVKSVRIARVPSASLPLCLLKLDGRISSTILCTSGGPHSLYFHSSLQQVWGSWNSGGKLPEPSTARFTYQPLLLFCVAHSKNRCHSIAFPDNIIA